MAYPVLADLKTWMNVPDTTQDTPLTSALNASIALFEKTTRRTFVSASAARTFLARDPWVKRKGQQLNFFAECTSITTVVNGDGTTITAGQYWALPDPAPFEYIELLPSAGLYFTGVNTTSARISVTALWGYSVDVPNDVRLAMLELARGLYESSKQGQGGQVVQTSMALSVIPAGMPAMVELIAEKYRRSGM